jgi:hypothetical protein
LLQAHLSKRGEVNTFEANTAPLQFHVQTRKQDDQIAVIGNTLLECPDGSRMYAFDYEEGAWKDFGIYFGAKGGTIQNWSLEGGGVPGNGGPNTDHSRPYRFTCIRED